MFNGDYMEKIKQAVFDTGPFIHLQEIQQLNLLNSFESIFTTPEIMEEWNNPFKLANVSIKELTAPGKDFTKYLIEKYNLHLGEATGISLCRQEKIHLFFTDDLEARETAISLGLGSHGTLAIVLRYLRKGLFTKQESIDLIEALYTKSSLFLTINLKDSIIAEILRFNT